MRWGERGRCARAGMLVMLLLCFPVSARGGSLLPLATERAEVLPSGEAEVTLGVAYFKDLRFPPFTPPGALHSQTLVEVPQLGLHVGAGGWAEIQASYETIYLDEQATDGRTNWQFGSGDVRLFTKVWIAREREVMPALGLRFGTKLPNAHRADRLGTDDTDFNADLLFSKDFGPVSAHANLGFLLLGNSGPTIGHSFEAGGQDDLFDYALAVASAPLGQVLPGSVALTLLGELTGLEGSHHGGNDRTAMRFGIQLQRGAGMLYLGTSAGLVTGSENFGASAGFVYRFDLEQLLTGE
jgi:hypothetical protein